MDRDPGFEAAPSSSCSSEKADFVAELAFVVELEFAFVELEEFDLV